MSVGGETVEEDQHPQHRTKTNMTINTVPPLGGTPSSEEIASMGRFLHEVYQAARTAYDANDRDTLMELEGALSNHTLMSDKERDAFAEVADQIPAAALAVLIDDLATYIQDAIFGGEEVDWDDYRARACKGSPMFAATEMKARGSEFPFDVIAGLGGEIEVPPTDTEEEDE